MKESGDLTESITSSNQIDHSPNHNLTNFEHMLEIKQQLFSNKGSSKVGSEGSVEMTNFDKNKMPMKSIEETPRELHESFASIWFL